MFVGRVLRRFFSPAIRAVTRPSVVELAQDANGITTPDELFGGGLGSIGYTLAASEVEELSDEYAHVAADIADRYRAIQLPYPAEWAIEEATGRLLYYLVRITHPETVLEIGVGNGHSTAIILHAMRRNASGHLHSVDIRPDVGALLGEADRSDWTYVELDAERSNADLVALIARALPTIDLAFHDGGHDYMDQLSDYRAIWPHVRPGGVLVSDDVDLSHAFGDFIRSIGTRPVALLDKRKVVGIQRKPTNAEVHSEAMTDPLLSAVVCTRNRTSTLGDAIRSLVDQEYPDDAYGIIVVDDGSTDDTPAVVASFDTGGRPEVRYIRQEPGGLSRARNRAIEASRGEIVCFIDDDAVAEPDWLEAIAQGSQRYPEASCFSGRILLRLEAKPPRMCVHGGLATLLDPGDEERVGERAKGANLAIRRSAFERVGLFNVELVWRGDEDNWQDRLAEAGGTVVYLPGSVVWHRRIASDLRPWQMLKTRWGWGVGRVIYHRETGVRFHPAFEMKELALNLLHAIRHVCFAGLMDAAARAGALWAALRGELRKGRTAPPALGGESIADTQATSTGSRSLTQRIGDRVPVARKTARAAVARYRVARFRTCGRSGCERRIRTNARADLQAQSVDGQRVPTWPGLEPRRDPRGARGAPKHCP